MSSKFARSSLWMFTLSLGVAASFTGTDAVAEPDQTGATVHPEIWPAANSPIGLDLAAEARITEMLAQMSIEQKVGQVIQPEWKTITPEEVTQYHIGSIENGGGAVPGGNKHSTVQDWLDLIEPYYHVP